MPNSNVKKIGILTSGAIGLETSATTLGHIRRSSTPSYFDWLTAAAFDRKAVELVAQEHYQQMVIWSKGRVESKPLASAMSIIKQRHQAHLCTRPVEPDDFWVSTAYELGTYINGSY